jgi:hypothetical protein
MEIMRSQLASAPEKLVIVGGEKPSILHTTREVQALL